MEYRGMYEQEAYHKGYLEGKASMIDVLKSAPIKSTTYKLSESNSIEVLTQINKSQAKEIEGLRDILRRVDNEFEDLSNLDSPEIVSPNDKLWEEIGKLLSQGTTTQPDKGGD